MKYCLEVAVRKILSISDTYTKYYTMLYNVLYRGWILKDNNKINNINVLYNINLLTFPTENVKLRQKLLHVACSFQTRNSRSNYNALKVFKTKPL